MTARRVYRGSPALFAGARSDHLYDRDPVAGWRAWCVIASTGRVVTVLPDNISGKHRPATLEEIQAYYVLGRAAPFNGDKAREVVEQALAEFQRINPETHQEVSHGA